MNVNLIPKYAVHRNVYFSQYDIGREVDISLLNGTEVYNIPSGAIVKIQATKPSGLGFSVECEYEDDIVTVVSTAEMTDEFGSFPAELRISKDNILLGTANFVFNVEKSPHPDGTTDGTAQSIVSQITLAYETAMDNIEHSGGLTSAIKNAILNCFQKVAWIDQNGQTYYNALSDAFFAVTNITLNASSLLFNSIGSTQQLTATLVPSDSTAQVQWESSDTSVATVSSSGLVTSVADGNATITASVGDVSATCSVSVVEVTVSSLSAVLNASGHTFYVGDPVDDIKPYLTVTATYSDSTTATVPSGSYTLSGTLSQVGANTITVSYESVTTTVSVTCAAAELSYISAVYTQSGTVYDTDTLDSLKSDLVVTAHYSDSTTSTVASTDYTLSGTLTEGTSTITVTYLEKTTTFSVTVTSHAYYLQNTFASTGSNSIDTEYHLPASGKATIAIEFSVTSFSSDIAFILGNKVENDNEYLAFQCQNSSGKRLWGFGIPWGSSANIISDNQTARAVIIFTLSNNGATASASMNIKNVTSGTSGTYTNNYNSSGTTYDTNSIVIGRQYGNNGFVGTVSQLIIDNGEWSSASISSFLAGE